MFGFIIPPKAKRMHILKKILSIFFLTLLPVFLVLSCEKTIDPPDDPADPVEPTGYQQYGTPFDGIQETPDLILYEINLRAFSEAGNLQGVIDRLDELESMHINTLWLMPIYPIGEINSVNSPYSIRDFLAVSEEYGTLDDLRRLTDAAHARGCNPRLGSEPHSLG